MASNKKNLQVRLVGGFDLLGPDGVPVRLPTRKATALFAILALWPGRRTGREKLAGILWGKSGEHQARASLRQCLSRTRHALGSFADAIIADADAVALDPDQVDVDVEWLRRVDKSMTSDEYRRLAALVPGDLLDGLALPEAAFETWLRDERAAFREQANAALHTAVARLSETGDDEGAIAVARTLLRLDPFDEGAHRTLMRLLDGSGRRGDALRHYEAFRTQLAEELGAAPTDKTVRLADSLKNATVSNIIEPARAEPVESGFSEGEYRQAAVLYGRFDSSAGGGSDESLETLWSLAEPLDNYLARIVAAHGGRHWRQGVGGFIALFGVADARGNEAERALRCALALRDQPEDRPDGMGDLVFCGGIAQGRVIVRAANSGEPQELTAAGQPIERSESTLRLAADGEILVDDRVKQLLGAQVEFDADGRALADGSKVWRVERFVLPEAETDRLPLVGRDFEMGQISSLLDACTDNGLGQILLVRGEPGIGKTRLIEEAGKLAESCGFRRHTARILDFGSEPGQDALTMLVRGLVGADGVEGLIRRGAFSEKDRPHLYDLIDASMPDALREVYEAMEPESRNSGRTDVLQRVVAAGAADAPLLLIVEDIHWADTHTLSHLIAIARIAARAPVLLALTTRVEGDPTGPGWRAGARETRLLTLDLSPLRDSEMRAVSEGFVDLPAERVADCIARAEGNPLFLGHLLHNARDQGGRDVPPSIEALVQARLDRMPSRVRFALQSAAVLGQQFSEDALAHVLDGDVPSLAPAHDAHLILAHGDGYAFSHALLRDATYGLLLQATRRKLHGRAAQWFKGRNATPHAEHLDRAEDKAAARAYLEAARAQHRAMRYGRALALVDRGLEIATEPTDRQALLILKGEILSDFGAVHPSIETYREALATATDDVIRCRALIGMAAGMRVSEDLHEAMESLNRAEAIAGPAALVSELSRIHNMRGNLCFPLGRPEQCLTEQQKAVALARQVQNAELESLGLGGMGDAMYALGRMLSAREAYLECITVADRHDFRRIATANRSQLGCSSKFMLRFQEGVDVSEHAVQEARDAGYARAEINARHGVVECLLELGDWQRARDHLDLVEDLVDDLGAKRFLARALCYRAKSIQWSGGAAEAMPLLERALEICLDVAPGYVGPTICSSIALSTADSGRRQAALEQGLALLESGAVFHNHLEFHRDNIDLALREARWDDADAHANAVQGSVRAEPTPFTDFLAERGRALAAWGRGERDDASRKRLETLLATARAAGLVPGVVDLETALGV